MSKHILMVDANCIVNSEPIQIIHKHPDFSHKKRTDLDPWEFIATSYPIALANKIVPFLDVAGSPIAATRARTRSPKRRKSTSPVRRTRSTTIETDASKADNRRTRSPRKCSPAKSSTTNDQLAETATPQKSTLEDHPMPYFTPARSFNPLTTATPGTIDTVYTSRTISPGGTQFSPLKPISGNEAWSPLPLRAKNSAATAAIPSTLFSPAKPPPPTLKPQLLLPPLNIPTQHELGIPPQPQLQTARPHPFTYTVTPTILAHQVSLPTLTLRHNLSTTAIRDVFKWCHVSVSAGYIVDLKGWLIHFHDTARVREIAEVCLEFGLAVMARKAEMLLAELEDGFGRGKENNLFDVKSERNEESRVPGNENEDMDMIAEGD